METDLIVQIHELIATVQQAENQATEFLRAARAENLSFGFTYNHIDTDMTQMIGRLRYMELLVQRHQAPPQDDR